MKRHVENEKLREAKKKPFSPKQIIKGEYVFTPVKNAFNDKISYWISKDGYTTAKYCFSGRGAYDLKDMLTDEALEGYIRYFKSTVENSCTEAL